MGKQKAFAVVDSRQHVAFAAAVESHQRGAFGDSHCRNQRPVWEIVIGQELDSNDGIADEWADNQLQCQRGVTEPEDTKNRNLRLVAAACPSPTWKYKKFGWENGTWNRVTKTKK